MSVDLTVATNGPLLHVPRDTFWRTIPWSLPNPAVLSNVTVPGLHPATVTGTSFPPDPTVANNLSLSPILSTSVTLMPKPEMKDSAALKTGEMLNAARDT